MVDQLRDGSRALRPIVRTPEPPFARPREFARAAWYDLRRSWALSVEMAKRDVRAEYRQSMLGAAGVLLPVLAMTAAAVGFRRAGILRVDAQEIPYGLFVLFGMVLWATFLDALNAPVYGLLAERRLLSRTNAPAEAVVLARLAQLFFHAGIRSVLLAAAVVWYGAAVPGTVLVAPLGLAGLVALGTAVGLLLAPINLVYRDVSKMLAAVTTFWFFFSPVYFPPPADGAIGTIMSLNPVTPLLAGTRALALTGRIADPAFAVSVMLATSLLLIVCWAYLRVALPIAIERAGE